MNLTKKISLVGAVLSIGSVAQAAVVVLWDGATGTGDVVTAHQNHGLSGAAVNFSTTAFNSPASGTAAYYPVSSQDLTGETAGADFYSASDNPNGSFRVHNGGSNDLLARVQVTGPTSGTFESMIAWDFNTDMDELTIGGWGDFNVSVTSSASHLIFQDSGGAWHISAAGTTANTLSTWSTFIPITGGDATIGAASAPTFTGVQRVGYYQTFTTTGGGGVFATGFTATNIPEPSSIGLLALAGLCAMRRRRA